MVLNDIKCLLFIIVYERMIFMNLFFDDCWDYRVFLLIGDNYICNEYILRVGISCKLVVYFFFERESVLKFFFVLENYFFLSKYYLCFVLRVGRWGRRGDVIGRGRIKGFLEFFS